MGVCCYIAACEKTKQGVIIDPGGNEDEILAACDKEGITVKYIINTHGHPDHVCGNGRLKSATNAEIVMHAADADFFEQDSVEQFFSQLGLPASPPVDKRVKDGDKLTFGKMIEQGDQHIPVKLIVLFRSGKQVIHCQNKGIRMLRHGPCQVVHDLPFEEGRM